MTRKKKQTRKYVPKLEFRKNRGPNSHGHPCIVIGETSTKYKSIGLTTNEDDREPHVRLQKNPNPNDSSDSYIRFKVDTGKKSYYTKPMDDWKLSEEDKPIVRHITKKYKKSTNRKPKGYYDKKKNKKGR